MKKRHKPLPTIEEALLKYWGYTSFRAMQREIIEAIIAGKDTLALLPTGGGKSLTYQVPALAMEGICIVVTPLIALMKDQVDRLRQMKVPAIAIHSGLSTRQIDIALDNCVYGDIKLLYVAPERLASPLFRTRLKMMKVSMLAVDEAHCISQWGYDFRPSYLKIGEIREIHPDTPILALTASATESVCKDIMHNLLFKEPNILMGDFSRPNLSYAIRYSNDKSEMLQHILSSVEGSTIIYVRTRKGSEEISKFLNENGYSSNFYHGGLPHAERSLRQDEWISDEYRIMVATNAFGMGIDKPDVKLVIHYSMCDSLEAYYQEAGRAGRDGARSYAALIVSSDDIRRIESSIDREFPTLDVVKHIYDRICSTLEVAYNEGANISYNFSLRQFCHTERIFSKTVLSAIKILQMNNYITFVEEMMQPARIIFIVSRDDLYRVRIIHEDLDHFIRTILRIYDGVFTEFRAIDESYISIVSGYTVLQVKDMLKKLWRMRLIRYTPSNHSEMIYLEKHRSPIKDLYISPESYKYRKELCTERFSHMIKYSKNEDHCRSQILEEYFGAKRSKPCGVCDICIRHRREKRNREEILTENEGIKRQIIDVLKRAQSSDGSGKLSISPKNIAQMVTAPPEKITAEIDKLVAERVITLDIGGDIILKTPL